MTAEAVSSNDLCPSCGICCTGALFSVATLDEPGDAEILLAQGYPREGLQERHFKLPCPLLADRKCSVFPNRPSVCGTFRCELLKGAQKGAIPLDDALGHVRQAHALLARVREAMPEGVSLEAAQARWKPESFDPGAIDPAEATAYFAYFAYLRYMDRHFRHSAQWLVTAAPVEAGRSSASDDPDYERKDIA